MKQLEQPLDDAFKKLPQLPENARKGLATALPWLTLIGGVFSLLTAMNAYRLATIADQYLSGMRAFGYGTDVAGVTSVIWLSIIILLVQGVLFFVAFPALRNYKKSGWNLLLWVAVVSVIYSVVVNLFNGYFDLSQLIVSLLSAAVGLYLLFQVRSYFTVGGSTKPVSTEPKPAEKVETPAEKTDKEL